MFIHKGWDEHALRGGKGLIQVYQTVLQNLMCRLGSTANQLANEDERQGTNATCKFFQF